jgi:hypothetical protein
MNNIERVIFIERRDFSRKSNVAINASVITCCWIGRFSIFKKVSTFVTRSPGPADAIPRTAIEVIPPIITIPTKSNVLTRQRKMADAQESFLLLELRSAKQLETMLLFNITFIGPLCYFRGGILLFNISQSKRLLRSV